MLCVCQCRCSERAVCLVLTFDISQMRSSSMNICSQWLPSPINSCSTGKVDILSLSVCFEEMNSWQEPQEQLLDLNRPLEVSL